MPDQPDEFDVDATTAMMRNRCHAYAGGFPGGAMAGYDTRGPRVATTLQDSLFGPLRLVACVPGSSLSGMDTHPWLRLRWLSYGGVDL